MIITLDLDSDVPLYQQLRDRVVEGIAAGQLEVGSPLPGSRALANDFGINFHTVVKGYDLLRREGLVRLTRKSGAVVQRDRSSGVPSSEALAVWAGRMRSVVAEGLAQGMTPEFLLSRCREIARSFGQPEGEEDQV